MQISEKIERIGVTADELLSSFKDKPWFHSIVPDKSGRLAVLVKEMNLTVLQEIPSFKNNIQILVHFAPPTPPVVSNQTLYVNQEDILEELEDDDLFEIDDTAVTPVARKPEALMNSIDELIGQSNYNIVSDIFYEIHDGSNAVTNLSVKKPEIKAALEKLYLEFGFQAIEKELDR